MTLLHYRLSDARRWGACSADHNPLPCISCQMTPQNIFPVSAKTRQSTLDRATFIRLRQAFAPLLPNAQRWHFLDALLFRHLLQDDALLASCNPAAPAASLMIETLPALVMGCLQQGAIVRIAARTRYQNHAISNALTLKVGPTAAQ